MTGQKTTSHALRMDRKYRRVRHVYDLTRKYFLFGRDRAIKMIGAAHASSILEIGCGTGRNLVQIARENPAAAIYGFDISTQMLMTSAARTARYRSIRLACADASTFDILDLFGLADVDAVLMSYSLSMIPDRKAALSRVIRSLAPGGALVIVDFGDFKGYAKFGTVAIRALSAADAPPIHDLQGLLLESVEHDSRFTIDTEMAGGGFYVLATVRRRQ